MLAFRGRWMVLACLLPVFPPAARSETPRTDHYGDPLPPGVRFRLGTLRLRHDGPVTTLAWLSDGRTLATAGLDGTVRLWQIPGGKQLAKWEKMKTVAFSPDGRTLACGGEKDPIRLCDVATGKELRRLNVPKSGVCLDAFSPDGKTLAGSDEEQKLHLYAASTGKEIRVLDGKVSLGSHTVSFSPDGQTLAVATENAGIHCWHTATGKKIKTLGSGWSSSVTFSPDGKILAAAVGDGADHTVRLWKWPGGEELRCLQMEEFTTPQALAFSPDGKLLATGAEGSIRVWDPATGEQLRRFEGRRGDVWHLAFSPDSSVLASAGEDNAVTVWEVRARKPPRPLTGVGHYLYDVALTADGRTLLTHARDGALTLWDGRDGRRLRTLAHWDGIARIFLISPDGNRALVQPWGGDLLWWDVASGRRLPAFSGSPRELDVHCAVFSPDSAVLALGGFDGIVYLRETVKGGELRPLNEGKDVAAHVSDVAFSPDGRTLAASYKDGRLILWDLKTGRPRQRISGPGREHTWKLAFSFDGRLLAVVWIHMHVIHLFETVSGQEIRQLRIAPMEIGSLAFTPDNRILAVGDMNPSDGAGVPENAIRLWDLPTGKRIHILRGHQDNVHTLAFSPDGTSLVSGSRDDTVLCWDVAAITRRRSASKELAASRLTELWTDLASKDAARAQRAVAELIQAPHSALPFLTNSLPPVPPEKMAPIPALIADLDSEEYARRERASKELEKIGEPAVPSLRKALTEKPSLEMRRRIEALLEVIEARPLSPDGLRIVRALQVLETIGTPEARRLLKRLAGGAAAASLTHEARASLQRLERRHAQP